MLVHLWDVNVFLGYQGPGIFFRNKDSAVSNNTSTLLRFSGPDDGLSCTLTRTKLPSQPSPACQPGPKMPGTKCPAAPALPCGIWSQTAWGAALGSSSQRALGTAHFSLAALPQGPQQSLHGGGLSCFLSLLLRFSV